MGNVSFGLNGGKKELENKVHSIYIRYRYERKVDFKKAIRKHRLIKFSPNAFKNWSFTNLY